MRAILKNVTPPPGIVHYAHDLLSKGRLNIGLGMRAAFFLLCLLVLGLLLGGWAILQKSQGTGAVPDDLDRTRLSLANVFALATVLNLLLLTWFISASITRYEVMYPIYLLGLVIVFRGVSLKKGGQRIAVGSLTLLVVAQIVALSIYFGEEGEPPARFNNIVAMIPPDLRIAITPKMWLAFVQNDRPITLLYLGYDGHLNWSIANSIHFKGSTQL